MKKRKMNIIIVAVIVIIAGVSAVFFFRPKEAVEGKTELGNDILELIALVENREEAEQLAADYGIELIKFAEGVATFQTDKTYETIEKIGKEKGLTELSINDWNTAF